VESQIVKWLSRFLSELSALCGEAVSGKRHSPFCKGAGGHGFTLIRLRRTGSYLSGLSPQGEAFSVKGERIWGSKSPYTPSLNESGTGLQKGGLGEGTVRQRRMPLS